MTKKSSKKASKKKSTKSTNTLSRGRPNKKRSRRGSGAGTSKARSTTSTKRTWLRWLWSGVWRLGLLVSVFLLAYTVYLDVTIRKKFEGQKWALPAHVYTRPMELYIGQRIDRSQIQDELDELGYVDRASLSRVGSFRFSQDELAIYQREFRFWDEARPQQIIRIRLANQRIQSIQVEPGVGAAYDTEIVRLEPRLFGSVSPMSHEDRALVQLADVPPLLIDGLIANEDRQFYSHFGVNPVGIARAMVRNIRSGRVVQGGSTLTQQLVKNYFLSAERTLTRKIKEAIMAVLLEIHYSKDEILQAYINEVHLSQAGNRAIHGFGLASRYFYGRPLAELELHQLATLIAINNGSSKYNPIRNPSNALKRRDLVLATMRDQGVIGESEFQAATAAKLSLSPNTQRVALLSYPSFMGLVRQDLQQDYLQEDLLSDGLRIHTTLDPRIQRKLEQALEQELANIESDKGIEKNTLQVAAAIIRTDNGEVAALVGDRQASFSGYNRAISAQRPVGSLLKPFVFLSALEQSQDYSLASLIDDSPITVSQKGSPDWTPANYDGESHGQVMLIDALARSYNQATVRLGMDVGLETVADTIERAGYKRDFQPLPSMLLGAVPMTVLDVGQLYLTLASNGFRTPIKSVRAVLDNAEQPLGRYALDIEQVIEPEYAVLINYALQDVIRNGTARNVIRGFQYDYGLAGKTGTTDNYRDSWFAGFSGNYLMVVWVGRDDNQPTGLTGASGAARLWSQAMRRIPQQRLDLPYQETLLRRDVYYSVAPDQNDCSLSRRLPMLVSSLELENLPCQHKLQYPVTDDELNHYEPDQRNRPKRKKPSLWERIFG